MTSSRTGRSSWRRRPDHCRRLCLAHQPPPRDRRKCRWRAAMRMAGTNRGGARPTKRDGTPCGRLAMTRYGLSVCGAHDRYAAAVSGGAIRLYPAERSCSSPTMRRPCPSWAARQGFQLHALDYDLRRSPMRSDVWARLSRGFVSDDDLTGKLASDHRRQPCIRLKRDARGRLVPPWCSRDAGSRLR